ncbi:MAG: metallophosphoesterase [Bacteriovoracaceae bacterium]
MKSLQISKNNKKILIISDLHLGAGAYFNGQRNLLEDFYHDKELTEFLNYYAQMEDVELIINGDFLDFLAVPFVNFYDDEYWSEQACLEKLKVILNAHNEVFEALFNFLKHGHKKIVYIIGNHDAEFILPRLQEYFLNKIPSEYRERFVFRVEQNKPYFPIKQLAIKHGHEFEYAHNYCEHGSIKKGDDDQYYFIPPWGSYYVTRVVNKYKEERDFINQVKPIKVFILKGLFYDTFFTLRFLFSTCFYFFMVRVLDFFKNDFNIASVCSKVKKELKLFHCLEDETDKFFDSNPGLELLVIGHTHEAYLKYHGPKRSVMNTGTWTKMSFVGLGNERNGTHLTYGYIECGDGDIEHYLMCWKGTNSLPFENYSSRASV